MEEILQHLATPKVLQPLSFRVYEGGAKFPPFTVGMCVMINEKCNGNVRIMSSYMI